MRDLYALAITIVLVVPYFLAASSYMFIAKKIEDNLPADKQSQTEKPREDVKKVTKPIGPTYLNASFDLNANKLSVPHLGHDINKIYEAIKKTQENTKQKQEFETTIQYKERLAQQLSQPFYGQVRINSTLAFVVKPKSYYDADNQELIINIEDGYLKNTSNDTRVSRTAVLINRVESVPYYTQGRNVYNAQVEVKNSNETNYNLAINNRNNFEGIINLNKIGQPVKLNINDAKDIKPNLEAVLLVSLIEPYISNDFYLHSPTITEPWDYTKSDNYLEVKLLEVWIYDRLSGKIVMKYKGK